MSESNAVAKYDPARPPGTLQNLKSFMNSPAVLNSLKEVVTKIMTPERVVKMLVFAASKNPKLYQCTPESLLKAAMTSAQLGLDISGTLGRAWVIPYGNEATFMAGYLGLADLARRSGEIKSLAARPVYEHEFFEIDYSLSPPFKHKPDIRTEKKDSDIIGAYLYVIFMNGGDHFEWMTRAEIEKARAQSKAPNSPAWTNWYSEMCKKTVLRRGIKLCPISLEVQDLISQAEEDEFTAQPVRSVERGSFTMADLRPTMPEAPPAEPDERLIDIEASVLRQDQLTNLWNQYLNDLKKRKASKACLDQAKELLGAEYGTTNLSDIEQQGLADMPRFQMFLARCTTDLEKDDYLK